MYIIIIIVIIIIIIIIHILQPHRVLSRQINKAYWYSLATNDC